MFLSIYVSICLLAWQADHKNYSSAINTKANPTSQNTRLREGKERAREREGRGRKGKEERGRERILKNNKSVWTRTPIINPDPTVTFKPGVSGGLYEREGGKKNYEVCLSLYFMLASYCCMAGLWTYLYSIS